MEDKIYKFPSIEQFRTVVSEVNHRARYRGQEENGEVIYDTTEGILPTLTFRGSVKLHGTNTSIVYVWNPLSFEYVMQTQSKNTIITPILDHNGFSNYINSLNNEILLSLVMQACSDDLGYTPQVVKIYGEWCGGSIQKGVAISGLDKMFVIFAIKLDDEWISDDKLAQVKIPADKIYNILDYPTYKITIDFNNLINAAEAMTKLVDEVEKECPVGKAFGKTGVGEGIVWVCTTPDWNSSDYWFKTKGDEHKASKTRVKIPIDIERFNSMKELVDTFLTNSRLMQGVEYLNEFKLEVSRKSTGNYLKWIYDDIVKEELDTIKENGFEPKEISSLISDTARQWFFEKIDLGLGL